MALLAHQGGWDEILLVVGPILVMVALLRLARKRTAAAHPNAAPDAPTGASPGTEARASIGAEADREADGFGGSTQPPDRRP